MANRVLRDFTDSERVDALSAHAERFYTRLMMKADDYGRFFEDSRMLLSNLFPLKIGSKRENVTIDQIDEWKNECVVAGLLIIYEVKGKKYISINNFGQRLRRMVSRFPDPPTIDGELRTDDSNRPPESETESESRNRKQNPKRVRNFVPPSEDDMIKFFLEKNFPESLGKKVFAYYSTPNAQGVAWHDSRGKPVLNWKQKCISVWMKEENRNYGTTTNNNNRPKPANQTGHLEAITAVAERYGITPDVQNENSP